MQTEDASATGAAFLGMKAINIITDITSLKPKKQLFIEPNHANSITYSRYYEIFETLYETLRKPMHKLYHVNQ